MTNALTLGAQMEKKVIDADVILAGRHRYGNYLCIPNHDIGCELSDFSDIFWNEERIGSLMRKVDAVTVATGLVHLPTMASGQLKN